MAFSLRLATGWAALLVLATPALPQSQPATHIEVLEVVSSGFSGPGEAVQRGKIRQRFSRTPAVTGQVGTKFNMSVRLVGQPDDAEVMLRWVWRTPRPGLNDPGTGRLTRMISEEAPAKIGSEVQNSFEFRSEEQLVKGSWRAEVWNARRRLAVRRFAIR
ncbi:MAG: hypothetical protein K2Y27_01810 [Xanthobacteraceae bacterium]|nr:hypothetical protein [Xanthobacteraceae bacterium]